MRLSVLIIVVVLALAVACGCLWKGEAFVRLMPSRPCPVPANDPPPENTGGLQISNYLCAASPGNLGAPLAIPFMTVGNQELFISENMSMMGR